MASQDELTRLGVRRLAEWLAECLRIGWKRESMDALEKLWLDGHDKNGNLLCDRKRNPTPTGARP